MNAYELSDAINSRISTRTSDFTWIEFGLCLDSQLTCGGKVQWGSSLALVRSVSPGDCSNFPPLMLEDQCEFLWKSDPGSWFQLLFFLGLFV